MGGRFQPRGREAVIAVIAGEDGASKGLLHCALRCEGFEARNASTPDEAERILADHGYASCVLTIDARRLGAPGTATSWDSVLAGHPTLRVVITVQGQPSPAARKASAGANRILVQNPFDAAAVMAGVRRAVAEPPAPEARKPRAVRRSERSAARQGGAA